METPANPDDFVESFEYDQLGRQTLHVSFEGVVTAFVYDEFGRLEAKRFFDNLQDYDGGAGTPAEVWSYKYDAFGRVAEVVQPARTLAREYDGDGRLIVESKPEGVLVYSYDDLGRKTGTSVYVAGADPSVDDPQRVTSYTYDELGRLETVTEDRDASVTTDELLTTTYFYDLVGNLDRADLPNGVVTDYEYDDLNRLTILTHYAPDETPEDISDNELLSQFTYTVRDDGRREGAVEEFYDGSGTLLSTNTFTWDYDNLGRLISEELDTTDTALTDYLTTYEYDLTGNRLEKETDLGVDQTIDETVTYDYDANDRVLEEVSSDGTTTTYGYTVTQQTIKTVTDSVPSVLSVVLYEYNLQGRLTKVTTDDGTETIAQYEYDSDGVRVQQTVTIDGGTPVVTEYLIDSQNHTGYAKPIREIVDGTVDRDYTLGHQIISQQDGSGDPIILIHDGHGSTRQVADDSAAAVETYHYDAFGTAQGFNPSTAMTTWQFAGDGQHDQATGLDYHLQRWRGGFFWLTKDPFFGNHTDPQSFHKYLYVHGDPINGNDPTGLFFASISFSVGGIQGQFSAQRIGAGLVVLDRATTVSDAVTIVSTLVAGGSVPIPLLAGFLISFVPGSGLARIAGVGGRLFSPFIRAGRLAFDAGGSLASFIAHGGTGRLVDAADAMNDVYRGLRGTVGGGKKAVQLAGDMGAVKVADKLGLKAADDFLIRHTGIDGLYRHGDSIVIVEAKGYTKGTSVTLGQTKHGQQISQEWIRRKAVELRRLAGKQPDYAKSAEILEQALDSPGSIKVLLTKTQVSQAGDEIFDVAYEMRNWTDLGTNTFIPR